MRTIFLLSCFTLVACSKEVPKAPCEQVPATTVVSLFAAPNAEQSAFFSRNFSACKTRKLKKDPNALYSVGVSVLHGLGTRQDAMKAFLWLKGAADKDHRGAQMLLAEMFANGVGVPKSEGIAAKYLAVSQKL